MQPHQAAEAASGSRGPVGPAGEQRVTRARSSSRRGVSSIAAHPSVRVVLLGGGELPGRLKGPLQALFPSAHLFTAYGMTEACSSMTFGSLDMPYSPASATHHSAGAATASDAAAKAAVLAEPHLTGAAEQHAGTHPARPGLEAGRQERWPGAGAIPVGWPPPGIEMAIAPLPADGSSSSRSIFFSDTPVSPKFWTLG